MERFKYTKVIFFYNFGKMSPKIPLGLRIRKSRHRQIAEAQDILVQVLYRSFNNAVIHGGTAIWRCYGGQRFSEDIDVYIPRDEAKINNFFEGTSAKGIKLLRKKIGENSLYSELSFSGVNVRFEAVFKKTEGILGEYETVEGNLISVYTLSPEGLIKEKADAYLKRLKIRDLYDIYFLLRSADKTRIKPDITRLIKGYKPPVDEEELKVLIIEGIAPDAEKLIEYIKRW